MNVCTTECVNYCPQYRGSHIRGFCRLNDFIDIIRMEELEKKCPFDNFNVKYEDEKAGVQRGYKNK